MKIQKVKISEIKLNPNNPRLIKDDKFKKLVKSIQELPEMLEIRPIVVNAEMVVLGGNMRLKACKEVGMIEIPIIIADNLTEEQQREFLIKDNVSGGEWDFEMLANEWDVEQLEDWGLDVPEIEKESQQKEQTEKLVPYKKTHVLISCSADVFFEIKDLLQEIKNIQGIEYESTSN